MDGTDGFAVKVGPGFFDNPKQGLPSTSGFIVVLDAGHGRVRAVLLDNGYLTDVRTAAAGAVAARALARDDAVSAAVLGTGMQARLHIVALALVASDGVVGIAVGGRLGRLIEPRADGLRVLALGDTGAVGVVDRGDGFSTAANVSPRLAVELWQAARAGRIHASPRLLRDWLALAHVVLTHDAPAQIKAAMAPTGLLGANVRSPLRSPPTLSTTTSPGAARRFRTEPVTPPARRSPSQVSLGDGESRKSNFSNSFPTP